MPDTTKKPESEGEKVMKQLGFYGDKAYTGIMKDFKSVNSQVLYKGKNKESVKEIKKAYKTGDIARIAKALGLTVKQHVENKKKSNIRSLIERIIGILKRWGILRGPFSGTASDLKQQFEIISGVVNLGTLWADVEKDEAPLLDMLAKKRAKYTKSR